MDIKSVLRTAFPFISAAANLGGPPAVLAAGLLGKALGSEAQPVTVEPTEAGIVAALAKAAATPEQMLAAQKAELDFQIQKSTLAPHHQEEIERLTTQDRADARARHIAVRDYTPQIGFYILLMLFALEFFTLCKTSVPDNNKALVYSMTGVLGTLVVMAGAFFYGTTAGSNKKTDLLAKAQPIDLS